MAIFVPGRMQKLLYRVDEISYNEQVAMHKVNFMHDKLEL